MNILLLAFCPLLAFWMVLIDSVEGFTHAIQLSDEDKLIKTLLSKYKRRGRYARPVSNFNDTVTINYNMQLIQIMDLDEKNQVLTLNVWDRYIWHDIHMKWDPKDHGGVDKLRIPSDKIWIPDIKLYNYADERLAERRNALVVVNYTGWLLWMPQAIYRSSCEIDVAMFPFDIQNCTLKFGSWTYEGNLVDLMVLINETGQGIGKIDMSEYVESNAWEVLASPAIKHTELYSCCPDAPYVDITFGIIFQRRSAFYNYILILPCILLTSLTLVLFWIPPESPAKLMLGINIFVAFFLLMLLMEANLPPAAAEVPMLGTYYCLNMVLITLSSFLNAFVVNLSFYGSRRPLPKCLRTVVFDVFAKALCMDNLVSPFRDKTISELTSRLVGDRMPFLGMTVNGDGGGSKYNKKENRRTYAGGESVLNSSSEQQTTTENSSSSERTDQQQQAQLNLISFHLNELVDFVKSYRNRVTEKDRRERVAREWKAVGLIFDRIFFLVYLTTIITSLCVVLPMITHPSYVKKEDD